MTLKEKLTEYLNEKSLIEIVSKSDRQVTGILKLVGDDFITIAHSVDKEISIRDAEEGKHTKIEVLNLETSLLFTDIDSVSRIVSKFAK